MWVIGDIHGDFNFLINKINELPNDSIIIQVGDFGVGFTTKEKNLRQLNYINSQLEKNNQKLYTYRGNHDNPDFFKGNYIFSNLELLPDYSVRYIGNKKCLFIGGGISIDRYHRTEGVSYWSDEGVVLDEDKIENCDVLFIHTTGTKQAPRGFSSFVHSCAREDKKHPIFGKINLIKQLEEERQKIDRIIELSKPKNLFYGHFHASIIEEVDGIKCRLLDINEIIEFV